MENLQTMKKEKRVRRHLRVRTKIFGTETRPRLCVARSIKHLSAQLVDDSKGRTIIFVSDTVLGREKVGKRKRVVVAAPKQTDKMSRKVAVAYEVGKKIAEKAKELKIESVVFDRSGYKYHGRIKALAEGARAGGLKF